MPSAVHMAIMTAAGLTPVRQAHFHQRLVSATYRGATRARGSDEEAPATCPVILIDRCFRSSGPSSTSLSSLLALTRVFELPRSVTTHVIGRDRSRRDHLCRLPPWDRHWWRVASCRRSKRHWRTKLAPALGPAKAIEVVSAKNVTKRILFECAGLVPVERDHPVVFFLNSTCKAGAILTVLHRRQLEIVAINRSRR